MKRNLSGEQYSVIAIILFLFLVITYPFAQAILLGLLAALVIYPLHESCQKKLRLSGVISALLLTTLLSICVVLPLILIGASVVREAVGFFQDFTQYTQTVKEQALELDGLFQRVLRYVPYSRQELLQKAGEFAGLLGGKIAQFAGNVAAGIPLFVLEIILFLLTLYYGLLDGAKFAQLLRKILPFEGSDLSDISDTTYKICHGVIIGTVLAALVQGLIMGMAFWILGVPRALLFGTVTAVFSFIPILGAGPTGIGGAIYLAANNHWGAALGMLAFLALAATSDNIVKPWVLKGNAELHPLLGLTSALGALAIFGFLGLFLGPLIAALTIVFLNLLRKDPVAG